MYFDHDEPAAGSQYSSRSAQSRVQRGDPAQRSVRREDDIDGLLRGPVDGLDLLQYVDSPVVWTSASRSHNCLFTSSSAFSSVMQPTMTTSGSGVTR
ncbi:hypothetical protein E0H75_04260 [Kribbella capetownensis]|uniref:Uncharacterized protein n=1 Tax=Kribbella capetownensis TaxID=1572659 RepID=A0A4R0K2R2_9ACTN|nr:hypothetical protein [Kribbella capetownensis]TCC52964.1 hypothetical protein E0H75_04260 [Kribbella capetownensis]